MTNIFLSSIPVITSVCTLGIILSVAISFVESDDKKPAKKSKKSFVETGTMFLFFLLYFWIIKNNFGYLAITNNHIRLIEVTLGVFLILSGTYVNIKGRAELGKNWANHIKIYKTHQLKNTGMFSIVRHPLYASLIWIFFGGALVYNNIAALLMNILIFIPAMYYRAKQEEKLLGHEFPEYQTYKKTVPMFWPQFKTVSKHKMVK